MLSIGKLSVGQEAYYLEEVLDGAEDYFLHAGEAPGRWLGAGATAIGLDGEVDADDLRSVLAGNDPASGESLRSTSASLPGLDLTLSAPKSVSLVWGLGDEATAGTVVGCHERAVDAAITYLERHACQVRRGHAGAETADGHGFIAAGFRHRTSRLGDPTLHTHVLVANVTEGTDGRWTALDARPIYRQARTAGFVYQAVLRYELAQSLGLLFEEVEQGHADVAGIPTEMRREFSGRRRQILDHLERHGASSAKAAQAATLDTRNAKSEHMPEDELRRRWAARAERFGVTVEGLPTLVRTPVLDQSDDDIAARVTEANATFERRDVVRVVAQHATQGGALDDIEARADEFLDSRQAINLTPDRWTTPEMLAIERRTVELALAGVGAGRGLVARELVDAAIDDRPSLGADQARAVRAITQSGASVDVLVGPAGTGKTFCLDAPRDAWESSGHPVVGVALAARAAAQLELGAGIPSQTADRLLVALQGGKRRLDDRTVLVVDESGMLGTRRLAAPLSVGAVRRVHGVLHRALAQAMRWEWIWTNPASSATPPRGEPVEMRPPTPAEVQRLLDDLVVERPLFHLFLVLAATTGARRGQLPALRWGDVDFDYGSLAFQRALVEGPDGPVLVPTKTRRSHRVALDPATIELLQSCCHEARRTCGEDLDDAFVFAFDDAGRRPWKPNWVTKQFIDAREQLGLDHFRLHDLRHFMATQMLSAGVAVPIVAARLAHARASTTLNVYAHAVPGGDARAAEFIGNVVGLGAPRLPRPVLDGRPTPTSWSPAGDGMDQTQAYA